MLPLDPPIGLPAPLTGRLLPLDPPARAPHRSSALIYKKDTPQNDWNWMVEDAVDPAADEAKKTAGVNAAGLQPGHGHHPGAHPYRTVLNEVRRKLLNTKARMEALLAKTTPDDNADWCAPPPPPLSAHACMTLCVIPCKGVRRPPPRHRSCANSPETRALGSRTPEQRRHASGRPQ